MGCPRLPEPQLTFAVTGAADQTLMDQRNFAKHSEITYSRMIWVVWGAARAR